MICSYNNIKASYIYIYTIMWLPMYSHQQNKFYPPPPQRCLLAHFEATPDFSRNEFICPQ